MSSDNELLLVVALTSIVIAVGLIIVSLVVLTSDALQRRKSNRTGDRR